MRPISPTIHAEDIAKARTETLSDGVFAFVLTLLVLELRSPHLTEAGSRQELAAALLALAPKFCSWAISFVTACVIWLNHHRLFKAIQRIDHQFFWGNAFLLLWTSFLPFPTALIGDYPGNPLAVSFYGLVALFMGLGFVYLRWHAERAGLILDTIDPAAFRHGTRLTILMGPLAYLIGASLAWVDVRLAIACYTVVALYFVFPRPGTPMPEKSPVS
ncbi:MAG: TMEM175 family protein [bacterium]